MSNQAKGSINKIDTQLDQSCSDIASENIQLEPQSFKISGQNKSLNSSRYSNSKNNKLKLKLSQNQENQAQSKVNDEEQMSVYKNIVTGLSVNIDPEICIEPKNQHLLKTKKSVYVTFSDITELQSRQPLSESMIKSSQRINNIKVVRRRQPQKEQKTKKPRIGYFVWLNQDYFKRMKQNEAITDKKSSSSLSQKNKNKSQTSTKIITHQKIEQLSIFVSRSNSRQLILQQKLNNFSLENELNTYFSLKKNEYFQIRKICHKEQFSQLSSVENSDNISDSKDIMFPKSNKPIINQQNGIKYRVQRLINKIKLSIMIIKDKKQKNWKDIELPIESYNINSESLLRIIQKIDGRIEFWYNEYNLSFYFKKPEDDLRYYCFTGSFEINKISLEQRLPTNDINIPGCESKCLIF